ncbi:PHP domain-containing protein [Paenibacillus sp. GXUN7292]|uniref:PHP domain-containing protein n=1 Tax=Paenibacillus sp. GXUN7292 TaxID=3422499 RepID=UPI003D7D15E6
MEQLNSKLHNRADLHVHTTASDGLLQPAQVVQLASRLGLSAIAITDHDTTAGVAEAQEEGNRLGIRIVPGVEISTAINGSEIHILGYGIKLEDAVLQSRLQEQRNARSKRNELIIGNLNKMGIAITLEDVHMEAANADHDSQTGSKDDKRKSIGRPHIAAVLVKRGIVKTIREAFDEYLAAGAAAYAAVPRITPFEAIDWIRDAGGVSVIAHPGLYHNDRLVEELLQKGGALGIEAYHSDHDTEAERRYSQLAQVYNVLITGGSDYHGERAEGSYHGALGSKSADIAIVEKLMQG